MRPSSAAVLLSGARVGLWVSTSSRLRRRPSSSSLVLRAFRLSLSLPSPPLMRLLRRSPSRRTPRRLLRLLPSSRGFVLGRLLCWPVLHCRRRGRLCLRRSYCRSSQMCPVPPRAGRSRFALPGPLKLARRPSPSRDSGVWRLGSSFWSWRLPRHGRRPRRLVASALCLRCRAPYVS